uniref:Lipocalin-like n=1 Tax=Maylandia zebra TaxID=106582 RepID=A0A3P9BTZ1_9CICH
SSAAMASLRALLGVVLCSLMVSASEILPQADFDLQIAGKWYLTGMCSNSKWFVCRKASIKSGTVTLEPNEDGGFKASCSFPTDNCWKIDVVASKTDVPGKFTYRVATEIRVVDEKPDEYSLNHYINTGWNETYVENNLYGCSVDLSADVQEKFRQFSLQTDFLPENIFILPKSGTVM